MITPTKVIYSDQPMVIESRHSIFLAGPTPRLSHPTESWRPEALELLKGFDGTVLVPEYSGFHSFLPPGSPYIARCKPVKRPSGARETTGLPFRVGEEGRLAKDRLKNFLKITSW